MEAWTEIQPEPKEQPKPKFKVGDKVRNLADGKIGRIHEYYAYDNSYLVVFGAYADNPHVVYDDDTDFKTDAELELVTAPEFAPYDKVVARQNGGEWRASLFSHYQANHKSPYVCVSRQYDECLPYNEQTAKLIGTKDDYNG